MVKAMIVHGEYLYTVNPQDFDEIYDYMMKITDGDHEISSDAASWCELACPGETYEFREGYIDIVEV